MHFVDARTGTVLTRLYPQDKTLNASGLRRTLDAVSRGNMPRAVPPATGLPPLLARMLDTQARTSLAPPYLPKNETDTDDGETP